MTDGRLDRRGEAAGHLLVGARDVTVRYGRTLALSGVDLEVREGDFVGVVGPSGAGKSTLLQTVLGLVRPTSGSIDHQRGLRIGYVPQVGSLDPAFPLTVAECVLLARAGRRDLPWTTRAERREADEMLERLGLGGLGGRHLHDLSGGQRQRVLVARALLTGPQLIVLDEPTSGIDVSARHQVLHLLGDLHDGGRTIVLATHDLNGLAAHLPELVCLNRTVVARGAPLDVLAPPVLEATYGAPFDVLLHAGLPFVVDARAGGLHHRHDGDGHRHDGDRHLDRLAAEEPSA